MARACKAWGAWLVIYGNDEGKHTEERTEGEEDDEADDDDVEVDTDEFVFVVVPGEAATWLAARCNQLMASRGNGVV
jgi:prephenate dehydrogenase